MKYGTNGKQIDIPDFEVLRIQSALMDWAVITKEGGFVALDENFRSAIFPSKSQKRPRMLVSACLSFIKEQNNSGTTILAEAYKMLPEEYYHLAEFEKTMDK